MRTFKIVLFGALAVACATALTGGAQPYTEPLDPLVVFALFCAMLLGTVVAAITADRQ